MFLHFTVYVLDPDPDLYRYLSIRIRILLYKYRTDPRIWHWQLYSNVNVKKKPPAEYQGPMPYPLDKNHLQASKISWDCPFKKKKILYSSVLEFRVKKSEKR